MGVNHREKVKENVRKEYGEFISQYQNETDVKKIMDDAFMIHFYSDMYTYLTQDGYYDLTDEEYKILDSVGKYPLFYMFQDFRGRDYDAVHTKEGVEAFTKSFIEDWDNTIKQVEENDNQNVVELVKIMVDNEYQIFRMEEERKPSKQVFDDSYQIYFYTELRDYLCDCQEDCERLEDRHYRALYEDKSNILALLFEFYTKEEDAHITGWSDIHDMVRNYNKKYHQDILDRAEEIEIE